MEDQKERNTVACLDEDELLAENVRLYPVLYDKSKKGFKERDVVQNAWAKVASMLDFVETGMKTVFFINYI